MAYRYNDPYDYSTSSDDYNNDDDYDESDEDFLVDCPHCPNPVKRSNYDAHIERVHTCDECGKQMPQKSLKGHKDRKHMEICLTCGKQMLATLMKQHIQTHNQQCKHCKLIFPQQTLEKHIQDKHPFHSTLGMICLDKITDAEFNKLAAANRIYSKDGHLFKRL